MSYTHYISVFRNSSKRWKKYVARCNLLLESLSLEYELCMPDGKRKWEHQERSIELNGSEIDGNDAFILRNNKISICSTNRKPYDIAVVACCILGVRYSILDWTSDGDVDDFVEALLAIEKIFPSLQNE